jgi:outer membrane protein assembly factor BamA
MRRRVALVAAAMLISSMEVRAQRATAEPPTSASLPGPGLFPEPKPIAKAIRLFDERTAERPARGLPRNGFYVDLGDMITGSGFLAAGPGYRHRVFGNRALFETSAVVSTRLYSTAQARLEAPRAGHDRLTFGAQAFYQDAVRVNYFGLGNGSAFDDRSGYRLQTSDLSAYAVFGGPRLAVTTRVGWLSPVNISTMAGIRPDYPDTVRVLTDVTAPGLAAPASYLHADISVGADTRDHPKHATTGGLYQAAWSIYSARSGGRHSFHRLDAEAVHFVPVVSENWVLALRGWTVLSHTADGHTVPFYLMPNLGGRNLRGYRDYRFHDRNMQAYSIESRWALFDHVDTALFVDLGNVAPTPGGLFSQPLKRSYGAGIRLHNNRSTIARFDIARGVEGWHFIFKLNDPFRRSSQVAGRPPIIPFVP